MQEFTIRNRRFVAAGKDFVHVFGDFRIRVYVRASMTHLEWRAELITLSAQHEHPGEFAGPKIAAASALNYWKDEIEASDEADAQDSERDHQDYVRDNRLRTRDVI